CLLHSGSLQIVEDHLLKRSRWRLSRIPPRWLERIDEIIILIDAERPVRREAFDRKWPSDTHAFAILVWLIVKVLNLGLGGDRCVDLPLTSHPRTPPLFVYLPSRV